MKTDYMFGLFGSVQRPTDSSVNLTNHTVSVQVPHHASGLKQCCQEQSLRELRVGLVDQFPGQLFKLKTSLLLKKDATFCTFILKDMIQYILIILLFLCNKL